MTPPNQARSTPRAVALTFAGAVALAAVGCGAASLKSGTGGSGTGGTTAGTGGSASGGAGSCSNVSPCGGSVVGTWNVSSSCLKVSGALDLAAFGAGCPTAPVTGTMDVTGSWIANPDGTYVDNTVTTGTQQITLDKSCLVISSTPVNCAGAANLLLNLGYATFQCTDASGGGCNCTATVRQNGSFGLVSPAPSTSGNYMTGGSVLTATGDVGDTNYLYCVSGDKLTVTPPSTKPMLTGTVVFQKGTATATGGTTGSGGVTGTGGSGQGGSSGGRGGTAGGSATGGAGGKGSGGSPATGGGPGNGGSMGSAGGDGPCDIYKSGGTPCVGAHSTVRALFGAYGGKLYQVRNAAGATKDIMALAPGGFADGPSQDAFCMGTTCVITVLYDQSGKGNDLWYQGSTMVPASTSSSPSKATSESLTLSGHKVYSLYINPGNSYWVDASKSGIALGKDPEGMYMVTNSKHFNSGCCFDYGNSETDRKADGAGAMDALNFSNTTAWGSGAGNGPWVMADLEYGLFAQNSTAKNSNDPSQTATYVTAVLKNNGTTEFALRGGDATSGTLTTYWKGALPGGWSPMKKQGAIILGSGGDCCKPGGGANLSDGTFYEGAIVTGYPSDATEEAIHANVIAAGYGK